MAIPFMQFQPVQTDPRNAMLDTRGLERSIAGFRQGIDQAYDQETNKMIGAQLANNDWSGAQAAAAQRGDLATNLQLRSAKLQQDAAGREGERLKLEQGRFGLEQTRAKGEQETLALQREAALAKRFAAIGQMYDAEPDEAKATQMLQRLYESNPQIKKAIAENLPPEIQNDPRAISRYWGAVARGYVDPADKRLKDATITGKEAEADKDRATADNLRAKPSTVQKGGKDDTFYNLIDDPAAPGGKRAVPIGGTTPGAVDQQTQSNITGGIDYLGSLPKRYGGDAGSFGSAVGPVQGSDSSLNPVVVTARALGNVWQTVRNLGASGSEAWPSEVRRQIEAGTDTLAASIKPLIRKPGEGTWSDADQAKLNAIVGNLRQADGEVAYNRELGQLIKRLNANFGLSLPPLPGQANAPGTPGQGLRLKKDIGQMSINEIGQLMRRAGELSDEQLRAAETRRRALAAQPQTVD